MIERDAFIDKLFREFCGSTAGTSGLEISDTFDGDGWDALIGFRAGFEAAIEHIKSIGPTAWGLPLGSGKNWCFTTNDKEADINGAKALYLLPTFKEKEND